MLLRFVGILGKIKTFGYKVSQLNEIRVFYQI